MVFIPMSIDTLRFLIGPLPYFLCSLHVFAKNVIFINFFLILLAMSFTKFAFVCIFKSIPIMDDNFLSVYIFVLIHIISILGSIARFRLPGKPVLDEVRPSLNILKGNKYKKDNLDFAALFSNMFSNKDVFLLYIFL